MKTDEILESFHLLMIKKNQSRLSGALEARAYREEALKLKGHLQFIQSCEKETSHDG